MRSAPSPIDRTSSWPASGCTRRRRTARTPGCSRGSRRSGVRATRDAEALLASDADCVVYAGPAASRPREAREDFCRILASGKSIVTTSLPGLVYGRGSLPERYLVPIREACERGQSAIYSSGIEPGFGCDLFPIALMTMSHKVYRVRGIGDLRLLALPGRLGHARAVRVRAALDYSGGLKQPGAIQRRLGRRGDDGGRRARRPAGRDARALRVRARAAPHRDGHRRDRAGHRGGRALRAGRCGGRRGGDRDRALRSRRRRRRARTGRRAARVAGRAPSACRSTASRASMPSSRWASAPARTRTITACSRRACAPSTPSPGCARRRPGIVDALHLPLTPPLGALHPKRDGVPAFD